mgnify:CR=1 FL=1
MIYVFLLIIPFLYRFRVCISFKILSIIASIKICHRKYFNNNNNMKNDILFFTCKENNTTHFIVKDNIENIKTNYNFIAAEYVDENRTIDLDLNNNRNFMLIGNTILDYNFVKWYVKHFKNYDINDEYKVDLIDNNANIISLNRHNSLLLEKLTYKINTLECAS